MTATIPVRRALFISIASLLAGLVIGAAPSSDTSPASSNTPGVAQPGITDTGPGPATIEGGIPTGFARSAPGAVAAAVGYATIGQTLLDLAPTEVPATVGRFASAETAEAQTATIEGQLDALRRSLAHGRSRIRYVQSVAAVRLDAHTRDRARVTVWTVGVLWRQGAADPQADWATITFDLVWEDDSWKVWSQASTPGPSPAPNAGPPPVDAAELDRLLVGFQPWEAQR